MLFTCTNYFEKVLGRFICYSGIIEMTNEDYMLIIFSVLPMKV